jgi:hypothetical protein
MSGRSRWPDVRPLERLALTQRTAIAVRSTTTSWLDVRAADPGSARFAGHLAVLRLVVGRMIDAIEGDLGQADSAAPADAVYDRCRAADARLAIVDRLVAWYADKYDQRNNPGSGPVLRAADELVRSCWTEAFAALGKPAPTGPLVYLDPRFDAVATPRVSTPTDLRAPGDAVIAEFVRELPVPSVALPAVCRIEPWWIVLAAHETGHHLQYDLAEDLVARTRTALAAATGPPAGDDTTAACWAGWGQEVFADAVAVLTVGPGAAWAVDELQYGPVSRLVSMPRPAARYPPPAVRSALLGELARELGMAYAGAGADDVAAWLAGPAAGEAAEPARAAVAAHLALARPAARAVLGLTVDGVSLPELCGATPEAFGPGGAVARWGHDLAVANPAIVGRDRRDAARHGIAGGVAAYRTLRDTPDAAVALDRLRATLPAVLATCGPPGTLAAPPSGAAAAVADRLVPRLLAVTDEGEGG